MTLTCKNQKFTTILLRQHPRPSSTPSSPYLHCTERDSCFSGITGLEGLFFGEVRVAILITKIELWFHFFPRPLIVFCYVNLMGRLCLDFSIIQYIQPEVDLGITPTFGGQQQLQSSGTSCSFFSGLCDSLVSRLLLPDALPFPKGTAVSVWSFYPSWLSG